jgi:hypothetical protein
MRLKVPFREERERLVLAGVVAGDTNKEIARKLGLSEPTIKAALRALCRKNGVRTRMQLATQDGLDPGILDERIQAAVDKALAKNKHYQDDMRELRQTVEAFANAFSSAMNSLKDSQRFCHDTAEVAGMLRSAIEGLEGTEATFDFRCGSATVFATIKKGY